MKQIKSLRCIALIHCRVNTTCQFRLLLFYLHFLLRQGNHAHVQQSTLRIEVESIGTEEIELFDLEKINSTYM